MKYYRLDPEVAGGLGEGSELLYENGRLKEVVFLEYECTGWLGDELLTTHPCFIVTESLQSDIVNAGLRGMRFERMNMTFSDEWEERGGHVQMPAFVRLCCDGFYEDHAEAPDKDFYLGKYHELIVSERALRVLQKHQIAHCGVESL